MSLVKRGFCFLLVLILIPCVSLGGGISSACLSLLSPSSAEITLSLREYIPFGAERLEMLNDLLRHLAFRIREDEKEASVSVLLDQEEVFSLYQWTEKEEKSFAFSFEPNTAFSGIGLSELTGEAAVQASVFSFGLPPFLTADKITWIDAGFAALGRLPELFPEYVKTQEVKTRLKDVGLSVRKTVVTLPQDAVQEDVMKRLGEIEAPASLRAFLLSLSFSGRQQFTLYYDENGELMKANYTGQIGSPEDMRKMNFEWRGLRGTGIYDELTVKASPVNGKNRDTLTMKRTGQKSNTEETRTEFEWSRTRDRVKTVLNGSAELSLKNDGTALNGSLSLMKKTGDQETGLTAAPDLRLDPETGWTGTVGVSYLSGENAVIGADVKISPLSDTEKNPVKPERTVYPESMSEEDQTALKMRVQRELASLLLKALIRLPEEDLRFLNYEMSEELWQQVLQKATPSTEGGLD